ncbi:MAG: TM1266 family iron-only hydrogenase system putative regulator [Ruminococcus sp.]|nr:TM1266 family iron-only hydrogenase system putative regulator [Ruminococcus sp.]
MENPITDTRVAVISIIVENPDSVAQINEILHSAAEFIIGRMGIPYKQKNINIISVVIDAELNIISSVSGRLGKLAGVTVKTAYSKK